MIETNGGILRTSYEYSGFIKCGESLLYRPFIFKLFHFGNFVIFRHRLTPQDSTVLKPRSSTPKELRSH